MAPGSQGTATFCRAGASVDAPDNPAARFYRTGSSVVDEFDIPRATARAMAARHEDANNAVATATPTPTVTAR